MSDPERVNAALAANLKKQRATAGLSLDALAGRSGVSRTMLIQIEQGRTNPSVGTVARIADALGLSIARLLDYQDGPAVRIDPAERATALWTTPAGGSGTLLTGVESPGPLELWQWRLEPGDAHESEAHPPGTVELLHVVEGTLTLALNGTEHSVPAGSSASFPGDHPHAYRNLGTTSVLLTMVVSVPPPSTARR
ncbi:helix-turn-helix domain-containing protein [Phaeacidiphilus oryzae]|uniref:helix-turn-helix domain-containing protein n=1 Tax=Phaeacidiphilus oryzae TaxID=348818 RepID=UPI000559C9F8|nr:XRE family transcriptional regulator [Phaeacidiphilus oryzae]